MNSAGVWGENSAGRGTHKNRGRSPSGVFEGTVEKPLVTTVRKSEVEDGFQATAGWGAERVGLWC